MRRWLKYSGGIDENGGGLATAPAVTGSSSKCSAQMPCFWLLALPSQSQLFMASACGKMLRTPPAFFSSSSNINIGGHRGGTLLSAIGRRRSVALMSCACVGSRSSTMARRKYAIWRGSSGATGIAVCVCSISGRLNAPIGAAERKRRRCRVVQPQLLYQLGDGDVVLSSTTSSRIFKAAGIVYECHLFGRHAAITLLSRTHNRDASKIGMALSPGRATIQSEEGISRLHSISRMH